MKEPQPVSVGILRVRNLVFARQRRGTGHLDGFWEFPGGKVKPGETPRNAIVRELLEETGVQLEPGACQRFHESRYAYPDRLLNFYFYLIDLPESPTISGGEWVAMEELSEREFPPANRQVIEKLMKLARE